ncbi:MAG: hypothetical protein HOF76_14080 [Candidatus Scalindua sp.]|nr:hypothetical protein [Candidatus Scalindua sp.]
MCKLYENIRIIALGCLCLVFVGCSSYAPYRYSFSLIEPQNENRQNDVVEQAMSFEDSKVGFRFVPSSESIRVSIKNKSDHEINVVRDKAEYIDSAGKSHRVHYGSDYVQEVTSFAVNTSTIVPLLRIDPNSEITGYVWINNWPDFHLGQGPGNDPISTPNIHNRMEPFFPRFSFEGEGKELKDSTFRLVLPIDDDGLISNYTFTFLINDVVENMKD